MRKKTTIRFTPFEKEMIKKIADYLNWTYTEVIRRSLRFGLNSLLKFETNKKMDLSKLLSSMVQSKDDQGNDKPEEEKINLWDGILRKLRRRKSNSKKT